MWTFLLFFLRQQLARSRQVQLAQEMDQKVRRRQVITSFRLIAHFFNQSLHLQYLKVWAQLHHAITAFKKGLPNSTNCTNWISYEMVLVIINVKKNELGDSHFISVIGELLSFPGPLERLGR